MAAETWFSEEYFDKDIDGFVKGTDPDTYRGFLSAMVMDMERQFCDYLNSHYTLQDMANEFDYLIRRSISDGHSPDSDEWREELDDDAWELMGSILSGCVYVDYFDFKPTHFNPDGMDDKVLEEHMLSILSDKDFLKDEEAYKDDGNGRYDQPLEEMGYDLSHGGRIWAKEAFKVVYDVASLVVMVNMTDRWSDFLLECNNMVVDYATEAYQAVLDGTISISD